jgi:putative oxidoreductase
MEYLVLAGRILYAAIFVMAGPNHFTAGSIRYGAGKKVPLAKFSVPLSGIIAFIGGVCILLGYDAKFGAWLIVVFLLPVTYMMHDFWTVDDPMQRLVQRVHFMKNLALLGAALQIAWFGSGPLSLDNL